VKIWTVHERPRVDPVLVREGFSLGALIFGPFWLASRRAWLPAGAALLVSILILAVVRPPALLILTLGLAVILGLSGRDMVRWSLARSGYAQTGIVTARDEDEARVRLLMTRPDLVDQAMIAETAP
jgi:hypothetical protein